LTFFPPPFYARDAITLCQGVWASVGRWPLYGMKSHYKGGQPKDSYMHLIYQKIKKTMDVEPSIAKKEQQHPLNEKEWE
jgi:hypothetical protein